MGFDHYAKHWDTEARINRAKVIAKEIGQSVGQGEKSRAMEYGCGTGLISFNLIDHFKEITLLDASKGMIDVLNEKIMTYEAQSMIARQEDIIENLEAAGGYDVIYNSLVLHHISSTELIVKRFYELLNSQGLLCIVDLNAEDGSFHKKYPDYDGHNGFDTLELKGILQGQGFVDVEYHTFYEAEKVIDGEVIEYSLFIMTARK